MLHPLLNLNAVDFRSPEDICGFTALLSRYFQLHEIGEIAGNDYLELSSLAARTLYRLCLILPELDPVTALSMLSAYDILHRLVKKKPLDSLISSRVIDKAVAAISKNNRNSDAYILVHAIRQFILGKTTRIDGILLIWLTRQIDKWYLHPTGTTPSDTINRVAILLSSDLYAYQGRNQEQYKSRLCAQHSHLLTEITFTDYAMLTAALHLLDASAPYLTSEEYHNLSDHLATQLHHCPNANRFQQAAWQLTDPSMSEDYNPVRL